MNKNKILSTIGYILFPICIVQTFITVSILNLIAIPSWYDNSEVYQTMPNWVFTYVDFHIHYGLFIVMAFMLVLIILFFSKRGQQSFTGVSSK